MGGSARTASNVLVNLGARKVQIRPYTAQGGFGIMVLIRFLGMCMILRLWIIILISRFSEFNLSNV